MDGLHIVRVQDRTTELNNLSLILRRSNLEIMHQLVTPEDIIWVSPADSPSLTEIFFVLKGRLDILDGDGGALMPGDCFYTAGLNQDVRLKAAVEAELLYISDAPLYDYLNNYQQELRDTTLRIDQKDHQTLSHSQRVMRLSVKLFQTLESVDGLSMDDLVAASLFHDVGKCNTPDEILKKESVVTAEEYERIKRHPVDSEEILLRFFGKKVAHLARWHHERLDGSGYPDGLLGGAIPLGARILAVADSFEAMTAGRPYAHRKSYREAARELKSMPAQYDRSIVAALESLVNSEGFSF